MIFPSRRLLSISVMIVVSIVITSILFGNFAQSIEFELIDILPKEMTNCDDLEVLIIKEQDQLLSHTFKEYDINFKKEMILLSNSLKINKIEKIPREYGLHLYTNYIKVFVTESSNYVYVYKLKEKELYFDEKKHKSSYIIRQ